MGNGHFCNCKCGGNTHEEGEEIYNTNHKCSNEKEDDKVTSNKYNNNIIPIIKKDLNKNISSTIKGNYSFSKEQNNNLSFENENFNKLNVITENLISSNNNNNNKEKDSNILNKIINNIEKKDIEEPMILNNDSSIKDIIKNGIKNNSILINDKKNEKNKFLKEFNPNILKVFDINKNNINNKVRNKKNNLKENQNNLSNSLILDEINNLNEIFQMKNRDLNNSINTKWKQMNIYNIITNSKLNTNKKDEIMHKGNINKLVLSHIFKNCSMNIEKFCILTQFDFSIYHTKENFLLMKKPLFKILLNQIENCGRIDFSQLKINNLNGYFFMYINMKSEEEKYNLDNKEDENDIIFKIVLKEGIGKFFVLFSINENIIDEWVCIINFFMKKNKEKL